MDSKYLFTLVPLSPDAIRIVKANRSYHEIYKGVECLSFKATHKSLFPGRLLSIGRQPGINDVILPDDGSPCLQCLFYLVASGELMLEDATTGHHTSVNWQDDNGQQEKYSLQGDPRCRIIPLANPEMISINLGREVSFQFKWRISIDSKTVRDKLTSIAQATIASNQGTTLTMPEDLNPDPRAYEPRTFNTPDVPTKFNHRPFRQIHVYSTIESGRGWECLEAVDLRTGSIWAVKECRDSGTEAVGESWKVAFKREVEALARLSHRNIICLEHHQGWSLGRPVQIFFPLCKGNVCSLFRKPHRCLENPSAPESWVPSFINQALGGLAFIHKHKMVHRDIRPESILYDNGGPNNSLMFYISGFGSAVPKEFARGMAGTLSFMAPETTRYGDCNSASDVYSFGVTLLEVLNKYCVSESRLSVDEWRAKLKIFDAKHYSSYRDAVVPGANLPKMQPGHSRIQSLIDNYLVRKSLRCVLEQDPKHRATAEDACRNLLVDYPLGVDDRHHQREAAPEPRREAALQLRREVTPEPRRQVAPLPRKEVALRPRKELPPRPRREAALQLRREVAPLPREEVSPWPRREAAPQFRRKVVLRLRREVAPQPWRDIAPRPRREAAPKLRRKAVPRFRREVAPQPWKEVVPWPRRDIAPRPRRVVVPRPRVVFKSRSEENNLQSIVVYARPRGVKPRTRPRLERRPTRRVVAMAFRMRWLRRQHL
ncbi:hypothetical protein V498_03279 [Pseudogymnoascus sp. VKM F-4517 (FW-2822)]|nr:hypothetical protein V498_03279 [Pseudogymnoascus sp. VKM F-4517 (FW-2822)]